MSFIFEIEYNKRTLINSDYALVPIVDNGIVVIARPNDTDHTISIPSNWGAGSIFHLINKGINSMNIVSITGDPIFPGKRNSVEIIAGGYANFTCINDTVLHGSFIFSTDTRISANSQLIKKFPHADIYFDASKLGDNIESTTLTTAVVELPTANSIMYPEGIVGTLISPGGILSPNDSNIFLDSSAGPVVVALPIAADNSGKKYIMIANNVSNGISINAGVPDILYSNSGITGALALDSVGDNLTVISDGVNGWWAF
ncbi:MAG: hypothetical protein KAS12_04680 [Candidatus Aenigmarchaeota archaeon]|nr:hypothetical protein [Candidatus Aenigmarchaeota archaeon]